ncbi:MAG: hypothetical protein IT201_00745 [Thermoleophilia bacterium]|nr:hypothetical protein [Thermoleophilia bacterium]
MSWKSKRMVAGTLAALAVATGAGAALAATQDDADGTAAATAVEGESPVTFLADVAERIGIEPDELEAAVQAEALERLDQALADGRITEEQADRIRERIESGELPFGPGHGPGGRHGAPVIQGTADYLGLTPAELLEQLKDGKSLAEVAEANGQTADGLVQALLDGAKTHLDQAVEDGRLTREQADELLERLENRLPNLVERDFPGPRGMGHGPMGAGPGEGA